jgi:hypothetical protein
MGLSKVNMVPFVGWRWKKVGRFDCSNAGWPSWEEEGGK